MYNAKRTKCKSAAIISFLYHKAFWVQWGCGTGLEMDQILTPTVNKIFIKDQDPQYVSHSLLSIHPRCTFRTAERLSFLFNF